MTLSTFLRCADLATNHNIRRGVSVKRRRLSVSGERWDLRIALWLFAAMLVLLAILATADLLDGETRFLWDRRVTIWDEPYLFAASAGVDLVCIAMASVFYLAAISASNPNWLPSGLRMKPLPGLALMCLLTAGLVVGGFELASGEVTGRGIGHLTASGTPIRFGIFAIAYFVFLALVPFGWYLVHEEWVNPPEHRWKPTFEDPSKRTLP